MQIKLPKWKVRLFVKQNQIAYNYEKYIKFVFIFHSPISGAHLMIVETNCFGLVVPGSNERVSTGSKQTV